MRQFVPRLIEDAHAAGKRQGSLETSVLFVDISGFTRLMELALAMGDRGAEVISQELRRVFDPPVEAVLAGGGQIISFAGDAFTAVFPGDQDGSRAVAVAGRVLDAMDREGRKEASADGLEFRAKCGIDRGVAHWGICEDAAGHCTCYFRGDPIDGAAAMEKAAAPGEVVTSWGPAESIDSSPAQVVEVMESRPEILRAFVPGEVLRAGENPEIKPVVSVFVGLGEEAGGEVLPDIATHEDIATVVGVIRKTLDDCGGTFNKLDFGDKGLTVLAFFGAPVAVDYPSRAAVDFVMRVRDQLRSEIPAICLRAGVAGGLAYTGITGGLRRNEWTCLGDSVNLSARLMSAAGWGDVLTSERVQRETTRLFDFDGLGKRRLKGKSQPQAISRVTRRRRRADAGLYENAMRGRRTELARLHELLAPALEGRFAGMVYLYGEAGIGKTRLAHEFRREAVAPAAVGVDGVRWVRLSCQQRDIGLQPIRHWLEELVEVDPFTPRDEKRARLVKFLQEIGSDPRTRQTAREELERDTPYLASILGCEELPITSPGLANPKLRHENQLHAAKELVKALACSSPLVLEIEDAHLLEPATAEWLRVMTRNIADVPLYILLTSRLADDGSYPQTDVDATVPVFELALEPLGEEQASEMFEERLGAPGSPTLVSTLARITHGNPFFLEQMIAHFRERNLLVEADGGMELAPGGSERLPESLESVLLSRFDRLEADVRAGLKHAATLGVRFLRRVLLELLRRSDEFNGRTDVVLPRAEAEGMVQRAAAATAMPPDSTHAQELHGEDAYLFRHVLMQQAAYELQPPSVRMRVHQIAADVIEELFADRGEYFVELAEQFGRAGDAAKEVLYLGKGADFAASGFRNEEALTLYSRLLDRLRGIEPPDQPARVSACHGQGRVFMLSGRWESAAEVLLEGIAIAEATGDDRLLLEGKSWLGNVRREQGRMDEAGKLLRSAVLLGNQSGDIKGEARASGLLGNVHFQLGDYDGAMKWFERLLELSEQIDDTDGKAVAIGSMGNVYECRGEYARSMDAFRRRLALSKETGDRYGQASAIGSMGIVYRDLGDTGNAIRCHQEFLSLSEEFGDRAHVAMGLGNLGLAHHDQGDLDQAMEYFDRQLAISEELGDRSGKGRALGGMASVHLAQDQPDRALECSRTSLSLARSLGSPLFEAGALTGIGAALLHQGETEAAIVEFRTALRIYEDINVTHGAVQAILGLARALCAFGESQRADSRSRIDAATEAREILVRARALATDLGRQSYLDEIEEIAALLG